MIQITVQNEVYAYDMYHITKAFYPNEVFEQYVDENFPQLIEISIKELDEGCKEVFKIEKNEVARIEERKLRKRYVNLKLYDWLCEKNQTELAWGILTGVRPTKLMMTLLESGMSEDEVKQWMKENYRITDAKAELGIQVAQKEKELLEQLDYENGYSLYIGIPFCPSICSYCSFSSGELGNGKLVAPYVDALVRELERLDEQG